MGFVFQAEVAREIVDALASVEAAEAGRRFIYTVSTQSEAAQIGTGDHSGLLRTHSAETVTIATDAGDLEIGWYEITGLRVAPDYS